MTFLSGSVRLRMLSRIKKINEVYGSLREYLGIPLGSLSTFLLRTAGSV